MPRIGITTGDPAGVGPEISLRAAAEAEFGECRLVLFGGRDLLEARARELGLPFPYESVAPETLHGGRPLPERAVVDLPYRASSRGRDRGRAGPPRRATSVNAPPPASGGASMPWSPPP
jgi:4-hydroxythreonine-4-phosphate dehydrogenase